MFAVIFKAEIQHLDQEYYDIAERMRLLAMNEYGCLYFISTTENSTEIAISYWENEDDIRRWKLDEEHQKVQKLGKEKWYKWYQIEIVEVVREYSNRK